MSLMAYEVRLCLHRVVRVVLKHKFFHVTDAFQPSIGLYPLDHCIPRDHKILTAVPSHLDERFSLWVWEFNLK